jgi:hypothetical protein
MSQIKVSVQPVSHDVDAMIINSVSVQLDNSASVGGYVAGPLVSYSFQVNLTPEEYAGWGSDDEYIVNLCLTKLNLTKA